ncbi:MAG: Gfo/Idh/MocA family oxidoreductase [Rhodothermales bacterium]
MYDIGVAVVGTGFIGPVHAEALTRLGVRVTGILGSTPAKSRSACDALGLKTAYGSFEEVLRDDAVQSIHLAVPNVLHYDMASRALAAGKHVMCEKPLAMTAKESAKLVEQAAASGLAAGVCYNIRFYPLNLEARARIESGACGDVISVVGHYVQDWLLYDTDYNWRVLADQGGALRAVSDIGTHWMDLVSSVARLEVEAVFADLKTVHPVRKRPKGEIATFTGKMSAQMETEPVEITTDDCGAVLLRFKQGGRGVLWVSQVTAGRKNSLRYEISGTKGALGWSSETPNELWVGHRNQPNETLIKDPALMNDLVRPFANYPGGHNEGFPDTFKQCFRAFYDAIRDGIPAEKALYPTFADGHKEIVICDAIVQSNREQRWVSV